MNSNTPFGSGIPQNNNNSQGGGGFGSSMISNQQQQQQHQQRQSFQQRQSNQGGQNNQNSGNSNSTSQQRQQQQKPKRQQTQKQTQQKQQQFGAGINMGSGAAQRQGGAGIFGNANAAQGFMNAQQQQQQQQQPQAAGGFGSGFGGAVGQGAGGGGNKKPVSKKKGGKLSGTNSQKRQQSFDGSGPQQQQQQQAAQGGLNNNRSQSQQKQQNPFGSGFTAGGGAGNTAFGANAGKQQRPPKQGQATSTFGQGFGAAGNNQKDQSKQKSGRDQNSRDKRQQQQHNNNNSQKPEGNNNNNSSNKPTPGGFGSGFGSALGQQANTPTMAFGQAAATTGQGFGTGFGAGFGSQATGAQAAGFGQQATAGGQAGFFSRGRPASGQTSQANNQMQQHQTPQSNKQSFGEVTTPQPFGSSGQGTAQQAPPTKGRFGQPSDFDTKQKQQAPSAKAFSAFADSSKQMGGAQMGGGEPTGPIKSKPCSNMQNTGSCKFGDKCRFSHADASDATGFGGDGAPPVTEKFQNDMKQMMKYAQKMGGGDGASLSMKDQQKMEQMMQYAKTMGYSGGNAQGSGGTGGRQQATCHFYLEGRCTKGKQCTYAHIDPSAAEGEEYEQYEQQPHKQRDSQQQQLQKDDDALPSRFLRQNQSSKQVNKKEEGQKQSKDSGGGDQQANKEQEMRAKFEEIQRAKKKLLEQKQAKLFAQQQAQQNQAQQLPILEETKVIQQEEVDALIVRKKKTTLDLSKQRSERVASPEPRVAQIHRQQWVSGNRNNMQQTIKTSQSSSQQANSYYQKNPIKPEMQAVTVLHYRVVLSKLAESKEAQKNLEKAGCLSMCSPDEVHQRGEVEVGAKGHFEIRPDGSQFQHLAVARFARSAGGKVFDVKNIRPPVILYQTISYLRDCMVDQDRIPRGQSYFMYDHGKDKHTYEHIYSFCRDRFRQITQELTMNAEVSVYDVRTTEELVRFFIISYHDCFQGRVFDLVQNTERLTHNLSRLNEAYSQANMMEKTGQLDSQIKNNIVRNKTEMFTYNLIATAMSSESTQQVISIDWSEYQSDEETQLVKEALKIMMVIKNMQFVEFFRILRRPNTNYFFACLMLIHLEKMRLNAIQSLYTGFQVTGFPISLVKSKLNLPSETDAIEIIKAAGYFKDEKNRFRRIQDQETWVQTWKKWRQSGPLVEHDTLRGNIRRSRLIKDGLAAFDYLEQDLGKENELDDVEKILNMPMEDISQNQIKTQESMAQKKAEMEQQMKMAMLKKQKLEEERLAIAEQQKIAREAERVQQEKIKREEQAKKAEQERLVREEQQRMDDLKREKQSLIAQLKDKKTLSKAKKKQLKEVEKNLVATSLKLSAFQRQIEIQRQEKKSIEVFFSLWKTNVKKIRKSIGLFDQINPLGSYLNDLHSYINDGSKDVKMFTKEDLAAIESTKLIKNQLKTFDLAQTLGEITPEIVPSELNVLFLSKNIQVSKEAILFNHVLDGIIFNLTNKKVSLFDIQNDLKPQIKHSETIGDIAYKFNYKECSQLVQRPKRSIKVNLMKTSLLAVLIQEPAEILNLTVLLNAALPKMAGIHIILFTLDMEKSGLSSKMGMFTELINKKKVSKIHRCPINIPQSELFEKVRKRRVQLNTPEFAQYLEFFIQKELKNALKEAPLICPIESANFRKIKLDEAVMSTFSSFQTLFNYAARAKNPARFEAEFIKYFNLKLDASGKHPFENCLQVANCWIQAMELGLKELISLCELSAQTLFSHERSDLKAFEDLSIFFMIKQISSMNMGNSRLKISYEDLEIKHMAFLLKSSLFKTTQKREIRTSLSNIENRSQSGIWSSEQAIFKGTLIAGVFLEDLLRKCKSHQSSAIYLLDSQKKDMLDEKDRQIQQAQWEAKLTEAMQAQLEGKNRLETSYAVLLAQKYPKDFDQDYKNGLKRKQNERLASVQRSLTVRPGKSSIEKTVEKQGIAEKRITKQARKESAQEQISSRINYVEQQMAIAQKSSLKSELMSLASLEQQSEDSSAFQTKQVSSKKRRHIQREINNSRDIVENEVQEFMNSMMPNRKIQKISNNEMGCYETRSSHKEEEGKVKDYASEIFKLIDSM